MLECIKKNVKLSGKYGLVLLKWLAMALLVGGVGGVIGSIFHLSLDWVTDMSGKYNFLLCFLPLGGLAIVGIYKIFSSKGKIDTNRVLDGIQKGESIPLVMMPLIFIGTFITHLFGGSAGREGAALQLGGSLGYNLGRLFRLKKRDVQIVIMSGMSAVFSALFGTPLTAAVFSLEVSAVGVIHYAGFLPCLISSLAASCVARIFRVEPVKFGGIEFGNLTWELGIKAVVLAAFCAVVSIVFCCLMKYGEKMMGKVFKNGFVKAFAGGLIIVIFTLMLGTRDYNGAGMDVIERAISGIAKYEAPLLKIIFTVITISAGFKGGEIVPTFFIGATFGCVAAPILGLDPSVAAAIGFVTLFCGVVNCPIASIFLAMEVFGVENIYIFAIACGVCYMVSGYSSLYNSQKILYSKIDDSRINEEN